MLPERFTAKLDIGDCWEWTAARVYGYGRFFLLQDGRKTMVAAHRFAYEQLVGPIPDNRQIDHLCRNQACVNPDHMELVTHRTNTLRGGSASALNTRKRTCPQHHPYDSENTYTYTKRNGSTVRFCRKCVRAAGRRYYARKAAP